MLSRPKLVQWFCMLFKYALVERIDSDLSTSVSEGLRGAGSAFDVVLEGFSLLIYLIHVIKAVLPRLTRPVGVLGNGIETNLRQEKTQIIGTAIPTGFLTYYEITH